MEKARGLQAPCFLRLHGIPDLALQGIESGVQEEALCRSKEMRAGVRFPLEVTSELCCREILGLGNR